MTQLFLFAVTPFAGKVTLVIFILVVLALGCVAGARSVNKPRKRDVFIEPNLKKRVTLSKEITPYAKVEVHEEDEVKVA